jgi:NAD(P)-dependent dehydrogenase (short-subunit alcohol dehydrogenase family)
MTHWTPGDIADLSGRTALITGANSGIGLETARVLAQHGARVILAGRSQAKLDEAVALLRGDSKGPESPQHRQTDGDTAPQDAPTTEQRQHDSGAASAPPSHDNDTEGRRPSHDDRTTALRLGLDSDPTNQPNSPLKLDTLVVDLGDLASIKAAAARIAATETVDILINNAGVMNIPERRTTTDGFETTFGTNHLGHFAFTAQLLPALRRSAGPRIVNVSALAATWRSAALTDLMSEQTYKPMSAYAKSKRANVVFTAELARRGIDAVVVHPGAAVTNLQRHTQGPIARRVTAVLEKVLMGSPEGAAWPTLYAATSADVHSGDFIGPASFRDQTSGTPKPVPLPRGAGDPDEGARLWSASERLTNVNFS